MNSRDTAEQCAHELIVEMGAHMENLTPLQLCTAAVLRGVVIGLKEAQRIQHEEHERAVARTRDAECTECGNRIPWHRASCSHINERPSTRSS